MRGHSFVKTAALWHFVVVTIISDLSLSSLSQKKKNIFHFSSLQINPFNWTFSFLLSCFFSPYLYIRAISSSCSSHKTPILEVSRYLIWLSLVLFCVVVREMFHHYMKNCWLKIRTNYKTTNHTKNKQISQTQKRTFRSPVSNSFPGFITEMTYLLWRKNLEHLQIRGGNKLHKSKEWRKM